MVASLRKCGGEVVPLCLQIVDGPQVIGQHFAGQLFLPLQLPDTETQIGSHLTLCQLLRVAPAQNLVDAPCL